MSVINQKEYLKKYLNNGKSLSGEKKKKKKKIKSGICRLKIIDDNDDTFNSAVQEDLLGETEDAPQIVEVIDDRPPSLRIDEKSKSHLWIPIGSNTKISHEDTSSPIRKIDEDMSPPRRKLNDNVSALGREIDGDISPPRKRVNDNSSSPERKMDRDMSPPRRKVYGDTSPPKRKEYEDMNSPRQDCDISPPRRNRKIADASLVEIKIRGNQGESLYRRKKSGLSKNSRWDSESSQTSKIKTLDGKSAGLLNAKDLVAEIEEIKIREEEHFKNLSNEISGANAHTIVRDRKTGKIRNFLEEAEKNFEIIKKKAESEEKYSRWGRGLKQVEDAMERKAEAINEMNKPLARYADDDDLEKYLKEQEREGDPMLAYIKKKKKKQDIEEGKPIKPEYMGEFMPNRFGIKPGHRWDGVNRSNGYEKRWFEVQNSRVAEREESYKWNTEDM